MNNLTFPAVALTDLDDQVSKKLAEADIVFLADNLKDTVGSATDIKEVYKKELLSRHPLTIKEFVFQCLWPLAEIISSGKGAFPEEYSVFILMVGGYHQAFIGVKDKISEFFIETSIHQKKLEQAFSADDIEKIEIGLKKAITDFNSQVESCKLDFVRDRSEEKKANLMLEKVSEAIVAGEGIDALQNLVRGFDISNLSSIYFKEKSNAIFGTPLDRLVVTILRLFQYWEVLHHCGYMNFSSNDNIEEMHWQKIC
jgi:hypothetical protein